MKTGYSIQFDSYKTFISTENLKNELNNVGRMNIIIGKNNAGKSKLIEFLEELFLNKNMKTEIQIDFSLKEEDLMRLNYSKGVVEHLKRSRNNIVFPFRIMKNMHGVQRIDNDALLSLMRFFPYIGGELTEICSHQIFDCKNFHKLSADRDILPEDENMNNKMTPKGSGSTSLLRVLKTDDGEDESLIRKTLLNALNEIYMPETEFTEIDVRRRKDLKIPMWEIKLREIGQKTAYYLTDNGSGLKTVILVLICLLIEGRDNPENRVFAFEELENNLHPAVERRLYKFIYEHAKKTKCIVFLTTHSQTPLNMFFRENDVQIYHVVKNNGESTVSTVKDNTDKSNIIDDLDIRASDLLQSNGIIWVEGPTDKYYIKKWMDLLYPDKFIEGFHYQFMMYGGSNLSHFTVDDSDEADDLIRILITNRKALVVMDKNDKLTETQERVLKECEEKGVVSWVTEGREIENYLSQSSIKKALSVELKKQCGCEQKFSEYMIEHDIEYDKKKVYYAKKIRDCIELTDCDILDLKPMIEKVSQQINNWNNTGDSIFIKPKK